jgi:hypothetical protein
MAELRRDAADLHNEGERIAWERITKAADRVVEKSDKPLSREQATDRYLRTDAGKADYRAYLAACEERRTVIEKVAAARSDRDLLEWAHDQVSAAVAKAQEAGLSNADAIAFAVEQHPEATDIVRKAYE